MPDLQYADPASNAEAWKLAGKMYELVQGAAMGGMPIPDVAAALAMLNGLVLTSAYGSDRPKCETAMRYIGRASVERASEFHKLFPRVTIWPTSQTPS